MAEDTAQPSPESPKGSLDLNSLSGLDFGPNWADEKSTKAKEHKKFNDYSGGKGKGRRPSSGSPRDRRFGGAQRRPHTDRGTDNSERATRGRGNRPSKPSFEPTVNVDLYPQDEAFDALVKRLRTSARTYQLFEIAHLLLEKPERYVVVVAQKTKKQETDGQAPLLYYSVPGHLPFESEEQAVDYVLKEHIELFFDVEEIELDAPSGNFQMVNRCGITGELLGPPNYHRYQEFVQRHYNTKISGMSFERFQSKIQGSKEQEDIDSWLQSMKRGARYTLKDRRDGEPEAVESLEAARHVLLNHRKDDVVGSGESIRFAGRDIERMPHGNIRRSVEAYIEQQKHFPLDSANNIRGRLRRHKFTVYKKGSKGVSFVCAVKRKFRDANTVFTDSINDLINFIEKHPDIHASKLSSEYIGIDTEKQQPEALKMKEPSADKDNREKEQEPEATSADGEELTQASEASPTPVEASSQARPKSDLSEAEQSKLNQLMLDLRWLITEGYVTEYGDGRLFAPAPLPVANNSPKPTAKKSGEAENASPKAETVNTEIKEEAVAKIPEKTGDTNAKVSTEEAENAPSEDRESSENTEPKNTEPKNTGSQ